MAVVILIAAAGGVALLTTKGKLPLLLPVKRVPKSVRSFGRSPGNIAHHADCGCGYRSNVMILWGLDGILVRLVSFITGLGSEMSEAPKKRWYVVQAFSGLKAA